VDRNILQAYFDRQMLLRGRTTMEPAMSDYSYALFETAIGICAIAWGPRGINAVQLPMGGVAPTRIRMQQRHAGIVEAEAPQHVQRAIARIKALLAGQPDDLSDIDLDLDGVSAFQRGVYDITRRIPPGRTLTYGDIAKQLGGVALSREVGQALGRNPCPIVVPCHRVLAAGNKPGGFSANGGVDTKLKMLAIEGAAVNHTPSLFD
jgi:methylated-DNA-[protein]-cysteine S-methyltransferase